MVTRLLRIAGHQHAVAVPLEDSHGQHLVGLVVLDDEDELRAHFGAAGLPLALPTTCWSSPSRSAAPREPRLRIVDTWPLRCLFATSVPSYSARHCISAVMRFRASLCRLAGSSSTTMTLVAAPSTAVFSLSRLSRSTSSFPSTGFTK